MSAAANSDSSPAPVGVLLREWRSARRLSQLELALDAGLSTRHLSYIENGKAQPSREMLARLADSLDMSLRERNALLTAAGFAPTYPETALARPELAQMNHAIACILGHQDPFPAFLLNHHWDVLAANEGAQRVGNFMMDGRPSKHTNMVRQLFDPDDFRAAFANWEEVAGTLIRHLHNHVARTPGDTVARALLEEALAYPGVPASWRTRDLSTVTMPLLTTVLKRGDVVLTFFSTITTFGTPRDVTLEELHIECCFPVDEATAQFCRSLK
ncbi:helix-turn-helix domain-containing protein [Massilia endophytica]|uniref:helix-turn-helix domain-containing protein n=1 Tax=Massilia endophytica TaxID=2899220 RepID=UPI001E5C5100|nr:helix-turn-helix transcriptional regulator [Massilia endophytica]UGQ46277.1 helix-turn-helix transcriptional regulator [Massilia endophytica]